MREIIWMKYEIYPVSGYKYSERKKVASQCILTDCRALYMLFY